MGTLDSFLSISGGKLLQYWFHPFLFSDLILFHCFVSTVRFWEPSIRILLIRVPRDDCTRVRASLTVWTHLEITTVDRTNQRSRKGMRIVASTLSVNGSARTAKRAAMLHVRKWYQIRIQRRIVQPESTSTHKTKNPSMLISQSRVFDRECRRLQDILCSIQVID